MFLIVYCLFFTVLLLLFLIGWEKNKFKKSLFNTYQSNEISVIIPFRDEYKNIPNLIASIQQLSVLPLEIIWVNDHSSDESTNLLQKLPSNQKLIELTANEQGKKIAIRKGIEVAQGSYILTWDADIIVNPDYFKSLVQTKVTDLTILPVRMKGTTILESLYELDYYFLNSINQSISGFTNPIVASGANLVFDKGVFSSLDSIEKHQHIASGDDHFLLNDFKKAGKTIQTIRNKNLVVETQTPHTFATFVQQRLRWISKSKTSNDSTTIGISILGLLYICGFIYLITTSSWYWILLFKITVDFLIFLPYLKLVGRTRIAISIPLFTLLYAIYFLGIGVGMMVSKPTWKGRT